MTRLWKAAAFPIESLCGRDHINGTGRNQSFRKNNGKTSMTALVLENLAALPLYASGLRRLLSLLTQKLDALVSARAARAVPEWRMRQVQGEIARHRGLLRAAKARPAPAVSETDIVRTESAICNFGR